ncbi:hypothetical protein BGW38_004316 [Lunasporangiospora selenospora]|uniref:Uncharacterized protein n=1 Tax=Lunasporangiospora selenospora TaxID=979761 RepID=A0A9P6FPF4_9FUNG|nr:hypothetical protein BGW38_004316 [Lunasporangiospora selenospora]
MVLMRSVALTFATLLLVASMAEAAPIRLPSQHDRSVDSHAPTGRIQIKQHIVVTATTTNTKRLPKTHLSSHMVFDEEDDDMGNELLDTEFDGLLRPDDDDTIEGQALEEEEDDEDNGRRRLVHANEQDEHDRAIDLDRQMRVRLLQRQQQHQQEQQQHQLRLTLAIEALKATSRDWLEDNGVHDRDLIPEEYDDYELVQDEAEDDDEVPERELAVATLLEQEEMEEEEMEIQPVLIPTFTPLPKPASKFGGAVAAAELAAGVL